MEQALQINVHGAQLLELKKHLDSLSDIWSDYGGGCGARS